MSDAVLLPATSHPPWTVSVAELINELENPMGTRLVLAHVVSEERRETLADRSGEPPSLDELAEGSDRLADARALLAGAGFDIRVTGVADTGSGEAILRTAEEFDVDRIYLYNRKRSPVGKTIYGSSVQEVITKATRPVVVVPSSF